MAIYVSGFICGDTIQEANTGLYSALRIADILTVSIPPGIEPKDIPPLETNVLIFYRSEGPERFISSVRFIDPGGEERPPKIDEIELRGGTHGHMTHVSLRLQPWKAGLWWIDVSVGDNIALRIPFEIIHTQLSGVSAPSDQSQTGA